MKKKILIGVIIVLAAVVFYGFVWIYTGTPSVRVNYVKKLNELGRPEGAVEGENALLNYQKAIDLYIDPNEALRKIIDQSEGYHQYFDLEAADKKMFLVWIEQNEPAWREYKAGSQRRYYWEEYDERVPVWKIIMPGLGPHRRLAKLGMWRAAAAREEGRDKEAMDDYMVVLRVGKHLQGKPFLV